MSAQPIKPKIVHFSHALYSKASHEELNMHDSGSISQDHKLLIGDRDYATLTSFYQATIEKQREMLTNDEKSIIEAHIHAIIKLDNHKPALAYALPSLDGIIFGKPNLIERKT